MKRMYRCGAKLLAFVGSTPRAFMEISEIISGLTASSLGLGGTAGLGTTLGFFFTSLSGLAACLEFALADAIFCLGCGEVFALFM